MKKLLIWGFRIGLLIAALFYQNRQLEISAMEKDLMPDSYMVVDKRCKYSGGGSEITIKHRGRLRNIEYYGKKCFEVETGDLVSLYYNSEKDYFHVPGSPINQRYVIGLLVLFSGSFVPWEKLRKRIHGLK